MSTELGRKQCIFAFTLIEYNPTFNKRHIYMNDGNLQQPFDRLRVIKNCMRLSLLSRISRAKVCDATGDK
jgi:hypothetical protein